LVGCIRRSWGQKISPNMQFAELFYLITQGIFVYYVKLYKWSLLSRSFGVVFWRHKQYLKHSFFSIPPLFVIQDFIWKYIIFPNKILQVTNEGFCMLSYISMPIVNEWDICGHISGLTEVHPTSSHMLIFLITCINVCFLYVTL